MKFFTITLGIFFSVFTFGQTFTKYNNTDINAQAGDWYNAVPVDIDNDYLTDLSLSGNPLEAYFRQNDSLSFSFNSGVNFVSSTGANCVSVSWVDMDNDCDLDVFFPNRGNGVSYLYRNDGNGVFTRITTGALATDILKAETASWGDYDGDGLVDVFLARQNSVNFGLPNWIYKNNGNFSFTRIDTGATAFYSRPTSSANWVDIDNDNDLDLFVINRNYNQNELYENLGGGHFIENDSSLLTNSNNYSVGADWGDYNNDGYQDVFIASLLGDNNQLYYNNKDFTFTKVLTGNIVNDGGNTYGSVWADFDNDGDLDLHTGNNSNAHGKRNFLYLNNGNSTFTKITTGPQYTEQKETFGNSVNDLNKDGFLDIIDGARYAGPISIFLGTPNTNNFINFYLVGSSSNKSAVGSRVVIKSATLGKQTRAINLQTGYNSQSDFSLHFGLGQDTLIDSVWVYWPSGNQCVLTNLKGNGFYNLSEANCNIDSATRSLFADSSYFLTTHFTNKSNGNISSYLWDFGDGDTSTQANPKHRYPAAGKYLVTLTAFDNYCKHRVYKDSIEVCPDTSSALFTYVQNGTNLTFSDASNMFAHEWEWRIDGVIASTLPTLNYTYSNSGQITVCLTVTDSCYSKMYCENITLCTDTLDASYSSSINLFTTTFTTNSTNTMLLSNWDFGDGVTRTNQNGSTVQHTYSAPGTYYVCHTISDSCNAFVFCDSIEVCLDSVTAGFAFSLAGNNVVNFTNQSNGATSYLWNFGDGNSSSAQNPSNVFTSNGTFTVCLFAQNDCTIDTICQTINLCTGAGTAAYTQVKMPNIALGIQFTSTSTNAVSHFWTFGDGSSSTNKNPLKIFSTPGAYNVCLAIVDSCGKGDTTCSTIDPQKIGLEEFSKLDAVSVYPNPFKETILIDQNSGQPKQLTVKVYSLDGKLVLSTTASERLLNLDLGNYKNGFYILEVSDGIHFKRHKLIKE